MLNARDQRRGRNDQRIIVDHQGAERRDRLDDAIEPDFIKPPRQTQNEGTDLAINAVAKLNDKRRIAGGQNLKVRHNSPGTTFPTVLMLINKWLASTKGTVYMRF